MSSYVTTITDANGSEHDIEIEFSFKIENDGIGPYEYWGAKGYDYGTDYMVIDEVEDACLVRTGRCKTKEECPKCDSVEISSIRDKDGKIIGYQWEHFRNIDVNSDRVDKVVGKCEEEFDWESEVAEMAYEPDYDDYDERY